MLIVIQYYIIIKIKKTKASRKDLKKGKNMMNQKKDYNMITKKLETELSSFHFDGLEISEITTSTSWMVLHINVLFIKDNVQITKVLYKDYQTVLWYYIKDKGMVISHKDTYNHTIKNLIDEMIYDVHFEIEEPEETEKHYADYTSEDFDTDALQPNKTIIEKIENINHCPNQNTCCIVSPFVHCNYNYKSDSCIKAHKNFINHCEQVHKQMKAKSNPEWHHVSLATLANIDNNMLDDKRRLYLTVWGELNKTLKNLHKCNSGLSYERALSPLRRWILELYHNKKITGNFKRYVDIKISMCNVECGVWSSAVEVATGQHESRRYSRPTLRY